MRRWMALLLLAVGLPAAAADPARPSEHRSQRPFSDVKSWAPILEDPARETWQQPMIVIGLLGVEDGSVVADLGAGTGYFTSLLSFDVGPRGRVYAVDTQKKMLDYLVQRTDMARERVVPVLAKPNDPGLPEGQVDIVLVVDTWHHVSKRVRYLGNLARALAPGGRVVVIDWRDGELPIGPRASEKVPRDQVVREFQEAGYALQSESIALPYQYFLIFSGPPPRSGTPPAARR